MTQSQFEETNDNAGLDFPPLTDIGVTLESLEKDKQRVAVEIPWPQVKGRLDIAYRELGQGVAIKGFRKGKVPRRMLEQMFGKHVEKEVSARLVQDSLAKAVTDHELTPVAEPQMEVGEIGEGAAFRYAAVFQVLPPIEVANYFGIEVEQRPAKVTDEQVAAALDQKRQEFVEFKPVENRTTQAGDVLMVDVMGKVDGQPYSQDDRLIELGDAPREPIPGLAAKLVNLPLDQTEVMVELDVPMHQHHHHGEDEACSGEHNHIAKAQLLVTIKDVKEKIVPALDDDFARDTGEASTLDELKAKLKDKLLAQDDARAKEEAKHRLANKIAEQNNVPAVKELVERQLDRTEQIGAYFMGGNPDADALSQFRESMRTRAEENVREFLVLSAISKKEGVTVNDADVEHKLAQQAAERGVNIARLRAEYEKKGRIAELRASLREEKTLDLLMSKAKIVIKEIDNET